MVDDHYPKIDFKNLSWEEYALILGIFLALIIYAAHIAQYKQIPSPIFGGDLYRDRGFVKNIVAGNPIWSDGFYANEIQYYPYLIFAVEAGFSKITGASVDGTFLYFPLLVILLAGIIWYLLGIRMFRSKKWAALTGLAFLGMTFFYFPKSAGVALFVTVPLFLYFWLKYEQEGSNKDGIYAGVMLGITALTWGGAFAGIALTCALVVSYYFIRDTISSYKDHGIKAIPHTILKFIKKYYLMIIIAFVISMIFFLPLILKYQLHEYNLVTKWGDAKIDLLGPSWIFTNLKYIFFDTTNITTFLTTIVALAGFIVIAVSKKTKETEFILAVFLSNIIILEHHLITRPLLNWWFLPAKMVYFTYMEPLFFVLGIIALYSLIKNSTARKTILIVAVVICTLAFVNKYDSTLADTWDQAGRGDPSYTNALYNLGSFLENSMQKNETVLSNDESGFMLAIVSGRKVMLTRRTHASYYVDIDQRIADASVAMYGHDINKTIEILSKYNVKYFYVDQQLFQYPMRVRPELKEYLQQNAINFSEVYDRYDIAVTPENANMQNLLIIPPQNITTEFTSLWTPVYTVSVGGQPVGEVYALKNG